jgi:hypothetical protein
MSDLNSNQNSILDDEFIDDIEEFIEEFSSTNINYYAHWGFTSNPFDQRPFTGGKSSVKSRRSESIKILIKELLLAFNSFDHILIKAPAGAGKSFLLQEFFVSLNTDRINKKISEKLPNRDSCSISMIDGFTYKELEAEEKRNYLIERNVFDDETNSFADILIIDNFAPLYEFWHELYPKYFGQSFIIASIQTSEFCFLDALKDPTMDIPIKESLTEQSQIQLRTSDPLEIFPTQINIPIWSESELVELLNLRVSDSHPEKHPKNISQEFYSIIAKNSLGLPGLCLDLAGDVLKKAISKEIEELIDEEIIHGLIDDKFAKARSILYLFKNIDNPKVNRHYDEEIKSIVNQLTKKTRKDLIKFLLISMGGYHIQTKQNWSIGTDLNQYFSSKNNNSVKLLAKSLSPTQLAIILDKKQSTLSYHLDWFREKDMIEIIKAHSINAFKNVPMNFDKIVLPPSPYSQLFEYILQLSPS